MKVELIEHTTDLEPTIATAVLTTTSKSRPSKLFHKLRSDPNRVAKILSRVEVQHGSVFDHNRLCWRVEATDREVLDILMKNRFFTFTRLDDSTWLSSSNLRTAIRYIQDNRDAFSEALSESIFDISLKSLGGLRLKMS